MTAETTATPPEALTDERRAEIEARLKELMAQYFHNKDVEIDVKTQNIYIAEEAAILYDELGEDVFHCGLNDDRFAVIDIQTTIRDVLDREGLSQRALIPKDDLKAPHDFAALTERGKLTAKLVADYTAPEVKARIRIARRMKKPKPKKKG